jgi:Tfp pilus assembly protein PilF
MKRTVFYIVAAVALFCGAFAPQSIIAQGSKQFDLYTQALKRLVIYRDSTKAYELVNQALVIDSTYTAANNLLSRLERDPQKALKAAVRAIATDSTDRHLLEQAAEISLRAKQYDRSKQLLTRIVKDSQEPDHFRLLALLHNMSKETDKALAVIDSAEVRLGEMSFFNRMRQQLYMEKGDMESALKRALETVEKYPYEAENHSSLADIYSAMEADSLAEVSYKRAIEIDTENPSLWFSYAGFLDSRKRHNDMLTVWNSIIALEQVPLAGKKMIVESVTSKRDFYRKYFLQVGRIINHLYNRYPEDEQVTDRYITHLIAANQTADALVLLKRRTASTAPTADDLGRIIEIENYLERKDSVELYVDRGIKLYPENNRFWQLKSWLQMERKDNIGAIKTLKSALKFAQDSEAKSSLWGSIGDQYQDLGEIRKCFDAYTKALNFNLKNAIVLNNYAYHLSVLGKSLKQALQMAQRATELSPNNATYLDTLAWVYYKMGDYEQAKKYMQQALSFDKNNSAELALHYGDILDALGNTFMAQTYWRKALERGADSKKIESRIEAQQQRLNSPKSDK